VIKIISIFDKHEDFIKLQYDSIVRHIKCDYEYIIFNNASTDLQSSINEELCLSLGIKCVNIKVQYGRNPSLIAGDSLNVAFSYFTDELIFKIDSDMFFISDINLDILFESDLIYIPNYKPGLELMWSGVFGINLSKIDIKLNFLPGVTPGTDTFGQSSLLTSNSNYTRNKFELYNLQTIKNGLMQTSKNNDCIVYIESNSIRNIEGHSSIIHKYNIEPIKYCGKYVEIMEIMNKYNFPEDYSIDFIEIYDINFMIHFKSSNWCEWYTDQYVSDKKNALKKFLNKL
jgi:hypothetical protein